MENVPSFLAVALPSCRSPTRTATSADASAFPDTLILALLVKAGTPSTVRPPWLETISATPGVGAGVGDGVGSGVAVGVGDGSEMLERSFIPESRRSIRASSSCSGARPTRVCVSIYIRPR